MNEICIVLYVNALYSQHLLNKPLTNRESNKLMLFPSQLFFSIVENLLKCMLFIISMVISLFINSTKKE